MRLRHPFEWLTAAGQKRAFILLLVLTLAVMVSLQILGGPLKTDVAPSGIVSFELTGELSLAQSMVESWGRTGQVYAGINLGLDYLFLVAYASAIGLGCVVVVRNLSERLAILSLVGVMLAWGQYGAALLDCIENYALIRILLGTPRDLYPVLARWCAVPKFLIVAAGLVYIIIGALVVIVPKLHRGNEHAD